MTDAPAFDRETLTVWLKANGVTHTTHDHPAVFRVEEGLDLKADLPGAHTKNLFLKDHKGRLWLISARQDTVIDLKRAAGAMGSGRLSFGAESLMWETLGVRPGSVTALGLINDTDRRVTFVLDQRLWDAFHARRVDRVRTVVEASNQLCAWLLAHERGDVPGLMGRIAALVSEPA